MSVTVPRVLAPTTNVPTQLNIRTGQKLVKCCQFSYSTHGINLLKFHQMFGSVSENYGVFIGGLHVVSFGRNTVTETEFRSVSSTGGPTIIHQVNIWGCQFGDRFPLFSFRPDACFGIAYLTSSWLGCDRTHVLSISSPGNHRHGVYGSVIRLQRWLGSRVVSVLDSGAEGPVITSQPRRCRVTVLGKVFTSIVPLFTKQQNW